MSFFSFFNAYLPDIFSEASAPTDPATSRANDAAVDDHPEKIVSRQDDEKSHSCEPDPVDNLQKQVSDDDTEAFCSSVETAAESTSSSESAPSDRADAEVLCLADHILSDDDPDPAVAAVLRWDSQTGAWVPDEIEITAARPLAPFAKTQPWIGSSQHASSSKAGKSYKREACWLSLDSLISAAKEAEEKAAVVHEDQFHTGWHADHNQWQSSMQQWDDSWDHSKRRTAASPWDEAWDSSSHWDASWQDWSSGDHRWCYEDSNSWYPDPRQVTPLQHEVPYCAEGFADSSTTQRTSLSAYACSFVPEAAY